MSETLKEAATYIEQGHVRVGPHAITDPAVRDRRNVGEGGGIDRCTTAYTAREIGSGGIRPTVYVDKLCVGVIQNVCVVASLDLFQRFKARFRATLHLLVQCTTPI